MKTLFVILGAVLVAALIALRVMSREEETKTAPEAQTPNRRQPLRPRIADAQLEASQETNAAETSLREKLEREGKYADIFAKQVRENLRGVKRATGIVKYGDDGECLFAPDDRRR